MAIISDDFDPHYLKYLAGCGATNLHALAGSGTERLRTALLLEPGKHILEIGCGTGGTMLRFASESQIIVDGVDSLQEMLRVARIRLSLAGFRNHLVRANAIAGLPFRDESYDAIFTESVLGIHSADQAEAFLKEVSRVLRGGGRFVANEGVWKPATPPEIISAIHQACVQDFGSSLASGDGWSVAEWTVCMERAGLTVISAEILDQICNVAPHFSWHRTLSRAVTLTFKAKASLTLRTVRQRQLYGQLFEKHRHDHEYIEARLFIATKTGSIRCRSARIEP